MIPHLTETARLEDRITAALKNIRQEWDHMLPVGAPAVRLGGGSQSATITAPDHGDKRWHVLGDRYADVGTIEGLLALRRTTLDVLNGWSRLIIEDRPVETALPDGLSAVSLCRFLERHAQWVSGHEAAHDLGDELTTIAAAIKRVTQPQTREWINLGTCPEEIEVQDGEGALVMQVCGGQVRAWPRAEDRDGEVMARCRRCGTEAVTSWWERRMFTDEELKVTLTDEEVVVFVHRAYGKVIKQSTVRQWVKRKIIAPSGVVDGKRVFDRHALVWALDIEARREALGL